MSLPDTLHLHGEICETMLDIILKENRALKSTGTPPDEAFLHGKRAALAGLSASLVQIRARTAGRATPEIRAAAAKAQQTILKALLVDRENEQLLLKCDTMPRPAPVAARPPAAQFQRAYATAAELAGCDRSLAT